MGRSSRRSILSVVPLIRKLFITVLFKISLEKLRVIPVVRLSRVLLIQSSVSVFRNLKPKSQSGDRSVPRWRRDSFPLGSFRTRWRGHKDLKITQLVARKTRLLLLISLTRFLAF